MPGINSGLFTHTYTSASAFPPQVWDALNANPRDSNTILPHALKTLDAERRSSLIKPGQVWITCSTPSASGPIIDFVLSCTEGPIDSYPCFIYTTCPVPNLTPTYLNPRLLALAETLFEVVPSFRIYSVFAPEPITAMFVQIWTQITGIAAEGEYYLAKRTYCTSATFVNRNPTLFPGLTFELQLAGEEDILQAAELCYGFADESAPFTLSHENALKEATLLFQNQQLWVHRILRQDHPPEIASIVAVTRESSSVSAISKVYTNPRWRRKGCAERLVRRVCKDLLIVKKKESVILFVAHDNPKAARVYQRVGFVGVGENDGPVEGVDSWLELGLDRSKVRLGHW